MLELLIEKQGIRICMWKGDVERQLAAGENIGDKSMNCHYCGGYNTKCRAYYPKAKENEN